MSLGARLKEGRTHLALTQGQAAEVLKVPRELVSMWETEARVPGLRQLDELARLYRVSTAYLLGREERPARHEREVLYRGLVQDTRVGLEVDRWVDFLDRWAEFLDDLDEQPSGPKAPPRQLNQGRVVTDVRRASALAQAVREYYALGASALPDLYAFLEAQRILVYRAPLGSIGQASEGVSGAFYNHPTLGYSILVNADTSPGRQTFTLAHEFCHALFHYAEGGLISRHGVRDATEVFANNFAGHFLVPGKGLRRRVRGPISPLDALSLARYFRVSYTLVLVRLRQEGVIGEETYQELKQYSPRQLSERQGMDACEFEIPEPRHLDIGRYPAFVLDRVAEAIRNGDLTPAQAGGLLDVDVVTLQLALLSDPRHASPEEVRERSEFEVPF